MKEDDAQTNKLPCADPVMGVPVDVWDMVNKYGTYNVQDTADTENRFPTIAQADGPLGRRAASAGKTVKNRESNSK